VRESEYRVWLEKQNYSVNTVNTQLAQARRLDAAYGNLDEIFARDRFEGLRSSLAYSSKDKREGKANPASFPIVGDLYANLASYRASLSYYARFAGEGQVAEEPDRAALEALKRRFIDAFPDFEQQGGFVGSSAYHREEDDYKRELVAITAAELGRDPPSSNAALGSVMLDALTKTNLLGYWKTTDHLKRIRSSHPGVFEEAVGALARSSDPPPVAAAAFLETVWPLLREGSESSLPFGDSRIYATVVQAMARPDTAISVIYQRFHNFGMALLGRPIFGNNILTEREYELVLELANYVLTVMDAEWGWHPRDLWDVQGFVWVTCKERLGETTVGPAIDRFTVEKMMDECDALGEAAFAAKYGRGLQGVRYRVVRGQVRYPSKAIANAAYQTMHGEPGRYGGTDARKVLSALGFQIVDSDGAGWVNDGRPDAEAAAAFSQPTNLILYGPPGTGKTFATAAEAVRLCGEAVPDERLSLKEI
jgi:hypothetical protein